MRASIMSAFAFATILSSSLVCSHEALASDASDVRLVCQFIALQNRDGKIVIADYAVDPQEQDATSPFSTCKLKKFGLTATVSSLLFQNRASVLIQSVSNQNISIETGLVETKLLPSIAGQVTLAEVSFDGDTKF